MFGNTTYACKSRRHKIMLYDWKNVALQPINPEEKLNGRWAVRIYQKTNDNKEIFIDIFAIFMPLTLSFEVYNTNFFFKFASYGEAHTQTPIDLPYILEHVG